MSRQEERGREARSFPRNDPLAVLPPPPLQASRHPLPEGATQAPRPSRARTHRSLSPHSSQQWPLLVISRAEGCGRDAQRSPGPIVGLSPPAPPSQSPSSAGRPTLDGRPLPGPLSSPVRSPGSGRARVRVSVRGSVSVGTRARVWPGIPAVPGRQRRGRARAAPSRPSAAGPARRGGFGCAPLLPLPGGSLDSAPGVTARAERGSGRVLLLLLPLRWPPRKRRRKAGAPPTPT